VDVARHGGPTYAYVAPVSVTTAPHAAKVWREDVAAAGLSALVIAGLYLDGWSHLNLYGGRLGSFFTPWHGMLYSAFSCNVAWIGYCNRHLWHPEMDAPDALFRVGRFSLRYPYAIFGVSIATVGMVGDIGWHTVLGEETGVARVIAPFHVVLVLGAGLLVLAPLRSAVHAPEVYPRASTLRGALPPIVALALIACLSSFVVQWVSPFVEWRQPGFHPSQPSVAGAVVLASFTLGVPMLLAVQRWPGAFGVAAIITGVGAAAMVTLGSYDVGWTAVGVVAGGLVCDVLARLARSMPAHTALYLVAVAFPLVTWPAYFVILRMVYDRRWPADLALGTAAFSALALCAVTFMLTLPDAA